MNKQGLKIGIIGTGNMGSAIIKGILSNDIDAEIIVHDIDNNKLSAIKTETGVQISNTTDTIINFSNILILAVKPDIVLKISSTLNEFNGIIISIAAGVSIKSIQAQIVTEKKIIRAMPNTPVNTGYGMTVLSPNKLITSEEIEQIKTLFSSVGEVLIMDEKHMNAVTAVSGSGPAYIFTFIQAMADAAVKLGIPRTDALMLAGQTILGSAKMFLDKKENPIMLRDNVTSPGGTTIAALHILEKAGFSGIIIDAIEAAANRAKELDQP